MFGIMQGFWKKSQNPKVLIKMKPEPLDLEDILKGIAYVSPNFSKEVKQRIREACEFYLRYRDKPKLLMREYPEYKRRIKKEEFIPNMVFMDDYMKYILSVVKYKEYNEWLFKLAFRGVLNEEKHS